LSSGPNPGQVELIVLVDEQGNPIGQAEKWSSHHADTPLHLAFSCYVFDGAGRLLVTRRAGSKKVWPGVWTNSVCGHPQPGESMEDAIRRRLDFELGMSAERIEVVLPAYRYRAPEFDGVVENEFCPVHFALAAAEPAPNPAEVADYRWVEWPEFVAAAESDVDGSYSWWCKDQLKLLKGHPRIPEVIGLRRNADRFEPMYQTTPPWDIGRPQPAFAAIAAEGRLTGRVLDVGCGTGEHALLAAGLGLEAVGIDAAPTAIDMAEGKASERGLEARFVLGDALELPRLIGTTFETVLDCGLFHVFTDEERVRYVESMSAVVPEGGRYFLLCFNEHQAGELGPRRVTQQEIRSSFAPGWEVESIQASTIELVGGGAAQAWLAELTRSA
jgi:isopentenyl-diphosphate delta-isomerase type 1